MASHLVCLYSITSMTHVTDLRVTGEHIWYRTGPSQLFFLLQGTYPRIFRMCDIERFH